MRRNLRIMVILSALLLSAQLSAAQRFYVEKIAVDGLGGYDLPCESYSARLRIEGDPYSDRLRFVYSSTCDGDENEARGLIEQNVTLSGDTCWQFVPERFGTKGCGSYDPEAGTLTVERSTSNGGIEIRWRECRGKFAGQKPCHE